MARISVEDLNAALARLGASTDDANAEGWVVLECPACGVEEASLRVNVSNGGYRCFRCGATSKGDGIPLTEFVQNPQVPSLASTVSSGQDLPYLTEDLVSRYARMLSDSPAVMADLERKRGWTEVTITQLSIGWDGSHLWIPVRELDGALANARMYDPFKRSRVKSFHYANAQGTKRTVAWVPFGAGSLDGHETVWMFEGEPDAILAAQMGFPSCVITGGAGAWAPGILEVVGERKVVVCYDMDPAGRKGARSVTNRLRSKDLKVLNLEFKLSDGLKDFTDAVRKDKRDARWFKEIAQRAWDGEARESEDAPPILVKLGDGVPGEPIVVDAHVLGTGNVPQLAPQTVEARCGINWREDQCSTCPCGQGRMAIEVESDSVEVIDLCNTPRHAQAARFKSLSGIPVRCPMVRFEVVTHWQVQHVKLIPPMSDRERGDSTVRSASYATPADGRPVAIKSNQLYNFHGSIVPDPATNEWLLLSSDARPAEDDIDSFHLDEPMADALRSEFTPEKWTVKAVRSSMESEENSLSRHITRIYGRNNILRLVDLCYHSVLRFPFRGASGHRGWLSVLVFGDTRTGKSETMSAFSSYVGMGRYVLDPANTTYAGLVGGLQQVGRGDKSWVITWGLVPTNDRGLVVIDELSSLSVEDIGKMSGMRSSGIAEITKIRNSSTPARTRLIMAGNPRGVGRRLSTYATPIEGIMDLIGAPEDVARFDVAVGAMQGLDKEAEDVRLGPQPEPSPLSLRRTLIRYAWSRSSDEVSWDDGVEMHASKSATKMAKDYTFHIPLVEPSEQDLRIARMAVASAIRTFSTVDGDDKTVLVRRCHVDFAVETMRACYDARDLGYKDYSDYLSRQTLVPDEAKRVVLMQSRNVARTCRSLLAIRRINPNSMGMALALNADEAREIISKLMQCGAARFDHDNVRNTAMSWTPDFIELLRSMERSPPEIDEEDLDY